MKKSFFLLLVCLLTSAVCLAQTNLKWNWHHVSQNGVESTIYSANGSRPQGATIVSASYSETEGPDGTPGIICCEGKGSRAYFGKISDSEASIELTFKVNKLTAWDAMLFSYLEEPWKYNDISLLLTSDSCLRLEIVMSDLNGDKRGDFRSFEMTSGKVQLQDGEFHTVKVQLVSGGRCSIILDNKEIAAQDNGMCFSDFTCVPPQYFPFSALGYSYRNCGVDNTFDGVISSLKIMNTGKVVIEENTRPSEKRGDINIAAVRTAEAPVIDGSFDEAPWTQAEWSIPQMMLGALSMTVNGLWESAEDKYTVCGSTSALTYDDNCLYVAIHSPYLPEDSLKAKQDNGGDIWEDDCVEFFLLPFDNGVRSSYYYQILANSKGKWTGMVHDFSGRSERWAPQDLKLAGKVTAGQDDLNYFDIEIAIPFEALGRRAPVSGDSWTCNFTREGASCGGLSTWAAVGTSFNAPNQFGQLIFGNRADYFKAMADTLKEELKSGGRYSANIEAMIDSFAITQADRRDLAAEWLAANSDYQNLQNQIMSRLHGGNQILVWERGLWDKFDEHQRIPLDTEELNSLDLMAAKGQRAFASFVVSNLTDQPAMYRLTVQDAGDAKAAKIAPLVRFREVAFLEQNGGKKVLDPIFDLPIGAMLRIQPYSHSVVWVDVDTTTLAPGSYWGTVRMIPSYGGFEGKALDLDLRVSPVDISQVFTRIWTYGCGREPWLIRVGKDYKFNTVMPHPAIYFPTYDENGTPDFPKITDIIRTMNEIGVKNEEIFFIFYPEYALWASTKVPGEERWVDFLDPEWKEIRAKYLRELRDWLAERGFSYKQYAFAPTDEPNGDPDDPDSKAYRAFAGAEYIKSVDENFQLFANPFNLTDGRHQRYFDTFDILEPDFPQMTPQIIEYYRNSGREIWAYSVLANSTSIAHYRRLSWQNMGAGFESAAAFYDMTASSGDQFNAYDYVESKQWISDYQTVYTDSRTEMGTPSLRMESWYLGQMEFKLFRFCQQKIAERQAAGEDTKELSAELDKIIQDGVKGKLEKAGRQLLKFAEKLI